MTNPKSRIAILASGSGTNAAALLEASGRDDLAGGRVVAVVSDREASGALERARGAGVEAVFVDPKQSHDREEYGDRLAEVLKERDVDLVCLAGFMKILPPRFIKAFEGRVLNIHPALLPSFPGANGVREALEWGVKVTGTTVHIADELTDHGPILLQAALEVLSGDDEASLHERIKTIEHALYPEAVRLMVSGRVRVAGRRTVIDGGKDDS